MTMTADDLRYALSGLSTERIQRLADRLSADPGLEVTIGSWFPQCPMVLAGFDGTTAPPTAPERRFAAVWDRLARSERSRWPRWPWLSKRARREDVQLLLRTANAVLALRRYGPHAAQTDAARSRARDRRWPAGQASKSSSIRATIIDEETNP